MDLHVFYSFIEKENIYSSPFGREIYSVRVEIGSRMGSYNSDHIANLDFSRLGMLLI